VVQGFGENIALRSNCLYSPGIINIMLF